METPAAVATATVDTTSAVASGSACFPAEILQQALLDALAGLGLANALDRDALAGFLRLSTITQTHCLVNQQLVAAHS